MQRPGWYMVAYDIANPRRLQRIHYRLKKKGLAVQQSVFFVYGKESRIEGLLNELAAIIKKSEDDIRAYPVTSPKEVWTTGGPIASYPLVKAHPRQNGDMQKQPTNKQTPQKSWWKKIF